MEISVENLYVDIGALSVKVYQNILQWVQSNTIKTDWYRERISWTCSRLPRFLTRFRQNLLIFSQP